MDDKTRIICNIYNLRRKSGGKLRPSVRKVDEEGLRYDIWHKEVLSMREF
jgi:hypothetical protein